MRKSSLVLVIVQPVTLVLRQTQPEGSLTQRGDLCFKKKEKKGGEKKNPSAFSGSRSKFAASRHSPTSRMSSVMTSEEDRPSWLDASTQIS